MEGKKYKCVGMRFGLAPAPCLATNLFALVMQHLCRLGRRMSVYIDKPSAWLTRSPVNQPHSISGESFSPSRLLGLPEKCNFVPLRSREFLGTQVKSKKMHFRFTRKKLHSIRREIQAVKQSDQPTSGKPASLLGKLNALLGAVISAQLHLGCYITVRNALAKSRWVDHGSLDPLVIEEMQ